MKLINLLPKARQEELHYEGIFRNLMSVFVLSLLSFAAIFFVQSATKVYLQAKVLAMNSEISQLKSQVNKQENADLKKKIQRVNGIITDYNNLIIGAPKWSKVLKAFAPLPPLAVKINTFSVNADKKTVSITGYAPTRELVIQLYNNILQDKKDFRDIDYPLENVVRAKDVNFHFTFFIQDSLLK